MPGIVRYLPLLAALLGGAASAEEAPLWIDVRTPAEYAGGHVRGAANVPVDQIDRRIGSLVSDKAATIWLYCTSGARSGRAKRILDAMGYSNVRNIGGLREVRAILSR